MEQGATPEDKRMRVRYTGTCRVCGIALPAKTEAIYERSRKTVRCLVHGGQADELPVQTEIIDAGTPGASARREFERRTSREERIRAKHPKLGGLILALSDEQHSTKAWHTGALGEERLGNRLNELVSDTLRVLHDRCIPISRSKEDCSQGAGRTSTTSPWLPRVYVIVGDSGSATTPHAGREGAGRRPGLHEDR